MKVTDDLELISETFWIEILSNSHGESIQVNLEEIDPLIEALKNAKTGFTNAPESLLRYTEILQIFEKEIKWCVDNPDKGFNSEYNKGFINALIQAKYLITQLAHLDKKGPGYMGDIGGIPHGPFDR